jgi:alpha-glucuronidase
VRAYARLLAAIGFNAVAVNNVNVHATEAHLLTDRLGEIAAIADILRKYGIRVYLSVSFAAPMTVGGLATDLVSGDRISRGDRISVKPRSVLVLRED